MARWKWYVYILECADGLYYTGMTWDIAHRMAQHASGNGGAFTSRHGFTGLRYWEEFHDITEARTREREIKRFSRARKERLWAGLELEVPE